MSTVASKMIVTPEDLLRLPDSAAYELADGQLVERSVSKESSRVAMQIGRLLGNEAAKTGEAEVYGSDLGYQSFPDDPNHVRRPDVSLIRTEKLARISPNIGFMPIAADLAIEVISPNDTWYDVSRKTEEYLTAGFKMVWIVDPQTRVVTVHRGDGSVSKLHENDELTADPALPSFRCRVGALFQI